MPMTTIHNYANEFYPVVIKTEFLLVETITQILQFSAQLDVKHFCFY
jgi:hypothetical protein